MKNGMTLGAILACMFVVCGSCMLLQQCTGKRIEEVAVPSKQAAQQTGNCTYKNPLKTLRDGDQEYRLFDCDKDGNADVYAGPYIARPHQRVDGSKASIIYFANTEQEIVRLRAEVEYNELWRQHYVFCSEKGRPPSMRFWLEPQTKKMIARVCGEYYEFSASRPNDFMLRSDPRAQELLSLFP